MRHKIIISGVLVLGAVFLAGCADDGGETGPEIVAISPADGATNVAKSTAVLVQFSEPMDESSCESRFGLFAGDLDTIPADIMERMHGDFTWNADQTVMAFHPDSLLMDSTMYSIYLQAGMMAKDSHGDGMMLSGMKRHGMEMTDGIISRFTTEKTSLPKIVTIDPANGATNVETTTAVQIEFNRSMDAESCESRFGLHEGELTEMPMMGMMGGMDGTFHWNSDSTMMTFQPDSMLMDSTMYTICLREGMQTANHDGTMMMSGMDDYGDQVENGVFAKFLTK
ncbi:MAG: Ig-like domain-containing protein [FCB group bacterium]|nr:Ig-like domain-containing protein [FCB group bacterium]